MAPKRFLAVLLGALLLTLTALAPILPAQAAITVIGQITDISCPGGTLILMSAVGRFTVRITSNTIITLNNVSSDCVYLKAGMNVQVLGQEDGENVIIADKIAASAPFDSQPFSQGGAIESTNCPNFITIATAISRLTIDVSGARIARGNIVISCQDLKQKDVVLVRGEKRSGKYYAKYVDVMSESTTFAGTVQQVGCPDTLTINTSTGSLTVNVKNAVFYLNGKQSSCSEIQVGDSVSVYAEKNGGAYIASRVDARRVEQQPFAYSGTIAAIGCPDTITIGTSSGNVLITLNANTVFKKNGLQTTCGQLKIGDNVTATGKKTGSNNLADQVIAVSVIHNFTVTGEILSLTCPGLLVVKTSSDVVQYDITGATLSINGNPASCTDFEVGDKVLVSGTVEGETVTVKIVAVTREIRPVTLIGIVVATDCVHKEVTVAVGNKNYVVVLPPTFTRNHAPATCEQIAVGDTCQAEGMLDGDKLFAITVSFASSGAAVTLSGVVKSVDCAGGVIIITTSTGDRVVKIVQNTVIIRDGIEKTCTDILVGDIATAHGVMIDNDFVATEIILQPVEHEEVWEGVIHSIDCANARITIKWGTPDSLLEVNLAKATIKLNGNIVSCSHLKVGMHVKVTGKIVPTMAKIDASLVEATATTGPGCDGPFALTGVLMSVDCVNGIIILRVGGSDTPIFVNSQTKIILNGVTSQCTDLRVGMTVTVSGDCDPVKGKVASEITDGNTTDPSLKIAQGILAGGLCATRHVIVLVNGRYIRFELDKTCVITIDGVISTCEMLRAGMNIVVYYKEINGVLVAVRLQATTPTNPPPPDDGGTNPPPPPPPGGGGGGGGTTPPPGPPVGEKEGDGFESVIMVTKIDCAKGSIEGSDEYNAGNKVVVKTSEVQFYYKDKPIACDKIKAGYLIKVKGIRGKGQEVTANQVEILPVSPVPTKFTGKIIEIDKVKGWVKLEKVQEVQIMSTSSILENTILIHIDPTTTFDYRGRKLTIADLRVGVLMEITGSLDPINTVMTTNLITIAARQAIAVNETGRVADVFCDKNMFWLVKDDNPESKYLLVKLSADTTLTIDGKQATCAQLSKDAYVTIAGKLDPFDLFISAEKVDAKPDEKKTTTIEGELMALDTMRQYLWLKVSDDKGVRFIQVKYTNDTKFLAFGKAGSVSDIAYASVLTVAGTFDTANAFIFNASSVESMGKAEENLTVSGSVVFSDCNGKVLFIKTANGVERFELTSSTKVFAGETIAACADIKEGAQVTLTFDRKGTKVFTTKVVLPPPKTIIKLTVGLGVISVNGQNVLIDAPPYIKNGTTMVPIRVVTTYFGASLEWDQSQRKLTLRRGKDIIIAWIGRMEALVNGKFMPLAQAPEYGASDRMMVPLRFFSEIFGAQVEWDQETKTVTIIM